ncbi:substrate-binding domain-containing protein [Actinoplanes sp. NPDC051411]|uniref:molybdate ABC transporter substrate-binding protein n=1 Tax=Actinoplanes sp. NPDC051411 TaxID=3155522 RepID=UPI0034224E6F
MTEQILGLSSMATKGLLTDLSEAWLRQSSRPVHFDSAGGVEVARRIRAGVRADVAVLSSEQMAGLDADGLFEDGTLRPLFVSDVVAAVPENAAPVTFSTDADVKAAVTGAGRIAYSTGPSGKALIDLLERWELLEAVQPRLVQARSGIPVGTLLTGGEADLGFQQGSELSDLAGIRILGPLPGAAAIRSTFSGAVLARSANKASARKVLQFLTSEEAQRYVIAAGMTVA